MTPDLDLNTLRRRWLKNICKNCGWQKMRKKRKEAYWDSSVFYAL